MVASVFLLGSSVTFCDTGDTYNKAYDQSDEYSSRWYNGREQITPQWTPDGSHIVFGHAGRIYVVDADGSDLRSLSGSFEPAHVYSQTAEIDFSPSVSPDGASVAYTTLRYATGALYEHTYEIATQAIDGSDRRRLTNNAWNDVSPAWSPDGSRIAFVSHREDGPRVFTIASDGSDERSVAPSLNAQNNPPAWSPDGSRLAFVAVEEESGLIPYLDTDHEAQTATPETYDGSIIREVAYTVGVGGSNLTRLEWTRARPSAPLVRNHLNHVLLPQEAVSQPVWSPDGKHLAFSAAFYGEAPAIYVMDVDGSNRIGIRTTAIGELLPQRFRNVFGVTNVSWSEDGSEIRFMADATVYADVDVLRPLRGIYDVASDGSQLRMRCELPIPSWYKRRYNEQQWRGHEWSFAPSPDGLKLAASKAPRPHEDVRVILYTAAICGSHEEATVWNSGSRLEAGYPD